MKKAHTIILIVSFLLFLLVQTGYYWQFYSGLWHMPVTILLCLIYVTLCIAWLYQFVQVVKNLFQNRTNNITITLIAVLLGLIAFAPGGLINYEALQAKDVFIAKREGAANCTTVFKLKSNGTFKEQDVCFGVGIVEGKYVVKNDTNFFSDMKFSRGQKDYYTYAVIANKSTNDKITGELLRYKNAHDTIPHMLYIVKNELNK